MIDKKKLTNGRAQEDHRHDPKTPVERRYLVAWFLLRKNAEAAAIVWALNVRDEHKELSKIVTLAIELQRAFVLCSRLKRRGGKFAEIARQMLITLKPQYESSIANLQDSRWYRLSCGHVITDLLDGACGWGCDE